MRRWFIRPENSLTVRMMILLFLVIFVAFPCCNALDSLPALVNVSMESQNFNHILKWSPGVGTPKGTVYKIFIRGGRDCRKDPLSTMNTKIDMSDCLNDPYCDYTLKVKATYGNRSSPVVTKYFQPFTETVIGPPMVNLTGLGDGLMVDIFLPARMNRSHQFYKSLTFNVEYRRAEEEKGFNMKSDTTFNLTNLQPGQNYCVRVFPESSSNKNMIPSKWQCSLTSVIQPRKLAFLVGWVFGIVLTGLCFIALFGGLVYTGILCKPKQVLPTALRCIVHSYYLCPEPIQVKPVFEVDVKQSANPSKPAPGKSLCQRAGGKDKDCRQVGDDDDDDDDDDEEEVENCGYMDTEARSSSTGTGSSSSREYRSTNFPEEAAENSGSCISADASDSSVKVSCNTPEWRDHLQDLCLSEVKVNKEEPVPIPDRDKLNDHQPAELDEEQFKETEEEKFSTNVNLFSVTLGALKRDREAGTEEDEDVKEECQPLILPLEDTQCNYSQNSALKISQTPLLTGLFVRSAQTELSAHALKPLTHGLMNSCTTLEELQTDSLVNRLSGSNRHADGDQDRQMDILETAVDLSEGEEEYKGTESAYLVTHTGITNPRNGCSTEDEDEDEEECFSGYMTR
ncbi:cytokine receptor family member b1 [Chanos chanos]|uniref:Cytokine receptor family member b1 n=1 Tax=Chanos chanos TaxID=29144 RepID=A0A6J2WA42_CHACN|nr:uncharacterized protein LOC115822500 [Chanos chanos]